MNKFHDFSDYAEAEVWLHV